MNNETAIKILEVIKETHEWDPAIITKDDVIALDLAIKALNERIQGKWITVYFRSEESNVPQKASMFDFVKCPFCETIHQGRHHFCSWCGADMREAYHGEIK